MACLIPCDACGEEYDSSPDAIRPHYFDCKALRPAEVPVTFQGQRARVLSHCEDAGHVLTVAVYRFPDGSARPYVEASERHGDARPMRVLPLPEAVHLLQNASEAELFAIGGREAQGQPSPYSAPPRWLSGAERVAWEAGYKAGHAAALTEARRCIDIGLEGR
jgi:hypothetical protein